MSDKLPALFIFSHLGQYIQKLKRKYRAWKHRNHTDARECWREYSPVKVIKAKRDRHMGATEYEIQCLSCFKRGKADSWDIGQLSIGAKTQRTKYNTGEGIFFLVIIIFAAILFGTLMYLTDRADKSFVNRVNQAAKTEKYTAGQEAECKVFLSDEAGVEDANRTLVPCKIKKVISNGYYTVEYQDRHEVPGTSEENILDISPK